MCTLVVSSRPAESAAAADVLRRATEILNPGTDSSAILEVTEWENGQPYAKSRYQVAFRGQNLMLLRKTEPEKDRGRTILLQRNLMWIELSAARKPLQLSLGQRWTSEAAFADLARANFDRDYRIQRVIEESGDRHTQHFFLQLSCGLTRRAAIQSGLHSRQRQRPCPKRVSTTPMRAFWVSFDRWSLRCLIRCVRDGELN
jgi:hypothetical protein